MQKISLSVDLVNSILQYMAGRPFQEVYQLIDAIQKEAKQEPQNVETVDTESN